MNAPSCWFVSVFSTADQKAYSCFPHLPITFCHQVPLRSVPLSCDPPALLQKSQVSALLGLLATSPGPVHTSGWAPSSWSSHATPPSGHPGVSKSEALPGVCMHLVGRQAARQAGWQELQVTESNLSFWRPWKGGPDKPQVSKWWLEATNSNIAVKQYWSGNVRWPFKQLNAIGMIWSQGQGEVLASCSWEACALDRCHISGTNCSFPWRTEFCKPCFQ